MDDLFKLVIEAETLSSIEVAQMLLALDKSFKAFVRKEGGRSLKAELTIGAVRHGSIEILIDAIDGITKLYGARHYLAPFASHLAQIFELATGLQLNRRDIEITAVDRHLLTSLAAPVAKEHAQQVNIVNHGSIVINVNDRDVARTLIDNLSHPVQVSAPRVAEALPIHRVDIDENQIAQLEQGKLVGTALLVDKDWYARLTEGRGVLVPITVLSTGALGLVHGQAYTFRGRSLHGERGETIGIAIDSATKIGT